MSLTKLVLAAGAALLIAPAGAAADKPSYGCAPPFNGTTIEGAIQLERTQQAIDDDLVTVEEALAAYNSFDANGDGVLCYKLPHGSDVWSRPNGQYLYNFVDNSASARQ